MLNISDLAWMDSTLVIASIVKVSKCISNEALDSNAVLRAQGV